MPASSSSLQHPRIASAADFRGRDFLTLSNVSRPALLELFDTARRCKAAPEEFRASLDFTSTVMLFEKPSLRTKMSFEVGIHRLGGQAIYLDHSQQRLGARESVEDYARNLERWVGCIIARVFKQSVLEQLAAAARCPVVNALSDRFHPCQAIADLFTLFERCGHDDARLRALRLAFIGEGNNVCHSLMHAASILGMKMVVITPPGFAPAEDVVRECTGFADASGGSLEVSSDAGAVEGSDAVYTDVWVSMGDASGLDPAKRREIFLPYQVNAALMARASQGRRSPALFMHCLPAQRNTEVTDDVIDSPGSVVYDQAENRMHAQNALLIHMLGR